MDEKTLLYKTISVLTKRLGGEVIIGFDELQKTPVTLVERDMIKAAYTFKTQE